MSQEVRLWRVGEEDRLAECAQASLNLEVRLEEWLARDISILSDELLVIGRQVETAFGGLIDLLCIDRTGDLVIVELKRDKTPREITAPTLDYASWVADRTGVLGGSSVSRAPSAAGTRAARTRLPTGASWV
jgi:hypothetical protein